jgi:hypothetical protein
MLITETELRDMIREELIKEVINKKNIIMASLAFLTSFANITPTYSQDASGLDASGMTYKEAVEATNEMESYVNSLKNKWKISASSLEKGTSTAIQDQKSIAKALKNVNKKTNQKKNTFSHLEGLSVKSLSELNKNLLKKLNPARGAGSRRARIPQAANLTGYLTNLGLLIIDHCTKSGSFDKLKENSFETYSNYIVSKITEPDNKQFRSTQDIYNYFKNLGMLP